MRDLNEQPITATDDVIMTHMTSVWRRRSLWCWNGFPPLNCCVSAFLCILLNLWVVWRN